MFLYDGLDHTMCKQNVTIQISGAM